MDNTSNDEILAICINHDVTGVNAKLFLNLNGDSEQIKVYDFFNGSSLQVQQDNGMLYIDMPIQPAGVLVYKISV